MFSSGFPRQWACACFLLLKGHQRPRKAHENHPIMPLISFLVGPRKSHENQPRVRRCFEHNDSEPRKSHENATKCATNSQNSGSLARPLRVVQDLSILWNFGHQACARGAKNTRPHDKNTVRLAVQTRPQSNQLVKRAVFTRDFFTCSVESSMEKQRKDPQSPRNGGSYSPRIRKEFV